MEDVLDVYHAPYDPLFPLVCMDESNKQLVGEVHAPLAAAPGRGQIMDHEYVRNGVADIFLEVEPLSGRRHVEITEQRTRKDWAMFVKGMLDERRVAPRSQCPIQTYEGAPPGPSLLGTGWNPAGRTAGACLDGQSLLEACA